MKSVTKILIISVILLTGVISASEKKCAVNLQLRWFHQFQFAGYYAAKASPNYDEVLWILKNSSAQALASERASW